MCDVGAHLVRVAHVHGFRHLSFVARVDRRGRVLETHPASSYNRGRSELAQVSDFYLCVKSVQVCGRGTRFHSPRFQTTP